MTRKHPHPLASPRGFTLIELMVVIVILGLLLGVVVPNVFRGLKSAEHDTALHQMESMGEAISLYLIENRSLPKTLDELTQKSGKTNEPFIDKVPLDPWKSPYDYKVMNVKNREYQITSPGEDTQLGTDDDIYFPQKDSK